MIKNNKIEIYNEDIKKFIEDDNSQKVRLLGLYNDLEKLKKELLKIYDKNIYHLGHSLSDIDYMGWDYNSIPVKNMIKITTDIQEHFLKMYVLVEKGLGNEILIDRDRFR